MLFKKPTSKSDNRPSPIRPVKSDTIILMDELLENVSGGGKNEPGNNSGIFSNSPNSYNNTNSGKK